ncbi:MAG: hypothetical protein NTY19_24640, partial [Planctomycetota bacterium]|nr:hypothetical protein [Planctomycetota bacterium]
MTLTFARVSLCQFMESKGRANNGALIVTLRTAVSAGNDLGGWWLSLSEAPVPGGWGIAALCPRALIITLRNARSVVIAP